jgi:hypothetical protein
VVRHPFSLNCVDRKTCFLVSTEWSVFFPEVGRQGFCGIWQRADGVCAAKTFRLLNVDRATHQFGSEPRDDKNSGSCRIFLLLPPDIRPLLRVPHEIGDSAPPDRGRPARTITSSTFRLENEAATANPAPSISTARTPSHVPNISSRCFEPTFSPEAIAPTRT